jgi:hypothetical protein
MINTADSTTLKLGVFFNDINHRVISLKNDKEPSRVFFPNKKISVIRA